MPDYFFNARDPQGKAISGQRKASSAEDLAGQLISEGLIPLDISTSATKKLSTLSSPSKRKWFEPKVKYTDLQIFCRQMYSLLHAGIPVAAAINRLAETTRNKTLVEALQQIMIALNKGSSLQAAMSQFPKIFSDFSLNLIRIGENTGNLDNIFLHLSKYFEMEVDVLRKIKKALRYPILVIAAILIALIVINVFVIPAFAKLFESLNATLPWATQILLVTSNFIIHYGYMLLGITILIILAIRSYIHTPQGAIKWGRFELKIPIIGWLIHRILLTRFSRFLSLVLRSGITAVDGIRMVGMSTNNAYLSQQIHGVTDLIAKGNTISSAIAKTNLFPPLIIQMILIGEESGTIDTLLDEVADYYQRETDYDIGRLNELIEPILLVIMGAMVLVLALGIYLPVWNLASAIKH